MVLNILYYSSRYEGNNFQIFINILYVLHSKQRILKYKLNTLPNCNNTIISQNFNYRTLRSVEFIQKRSLTKLIFAD